jgi:hypothetical protein
VAIQLAPATAPQKFMASTSPPKMPFSISCKDITSIPSISTATNDHRGNKSRRIGPDRF